MLTSEALCERFFAAFQAEALALVNQKVLSREDCAALVSSFARIAATEFAALVAEAQLQAGLVAELPGRRCVRPDHNGSDGRTYGYMCGGCAFELAQEEADMARRGEFERLYQKVVNRISADIAGDFDAALDQLEYNVAMDAATKRGELDAAGGGDYIQDIDSMREWM